jgi:mediator of RNA polymerase II transcription subunit 6
LGQLTSLYSLQSSLDTLRAYRPDYTPRTGFVWPIMDPSLTDDASKKRGADEELPSRDDQHDTPIPSARRKLGSVLNVSKKQQNNMLLLNAMKTTAIHSNTSFSSHALETGPGTESTPTETAHTSSGIGPSTTPVPSAARGGTPKGVASAPTPQDSAVKAPAGGGKKKRKREQTLVNGATRLNLYHDITGTSL